MKAVEFGPPSDMGALNGKPSEAAGFDAAILIIVVEGAVERAVFASDMSAVLSMGDLMGFVVDDEVVAGLIADDCCFGVTDALVSGCGKRFACKNKEFGCIKRARVVVVACVGSVDWGAVASKVAPLVTGNVPGIKPGARK